MQRGKAQVQRKCQAHSREQMIIGPENDTFPRTVLMKTKIRLLCNLFVEESN